MNILVLTGQSPYPPVSGGRKDVFIKIAFLTRLAEQVHLITLDYEENRWKGQPWISYEQSLENVYFFNRKRTAWAFFNILPVQVASRRVSAAELKNLAQQLEKAKVDAILCEGLFCMRVAQKIARKLEVPICLRSHNDEAAYFSALARSENSWIKKILLIVESVKVSYFEKRVANYKNMIMLSSIERNIKKVWTDKKTIECRYLPLYCDIGVASLSKEISHKPCLLFVGSLDLRPNVDGLRWFINNVWPAVLKEVRCCRLRIVGSKVPPEFLSFLLATASCELKLDQANITHEYSGRPIFVNPTRYGAGISVKTVEAMRYGLPIISTFTGARACPLSDNVDSLLVNDSDSQEFTAAVLNLLNSVEKREKLSSNVINTYNKNFGEVQAIDNLSKLLCELKVLKGRVNNTT